MMAPSLSSFFAREVFTRDFLDLILDGKEFSVVEVTTFRFWNFVGLYEAWHWSQTTFLDEFSWDE